MRLLSAKEIISSSFPDPIESHRRLVRSAPVALVLLWTFGLVLGWAVLPAAILTVGVVVPWVASRRRLRTYEADVAALSRGVLVDPDFPPMHPDEAALEAADRDRKAGERQGRWVRFPGPMLHYEQREDVVVSPAGKTRTESHWRRVLDEADRPRCESFAAYIKREVPQAYQVLVEWWEKWCADKVADQLYVGRTYRELEAEDRRRVRSLVEAEWYTGMHIVLQPKGWQDRYDKRPSHVGYSELRRMLSRQIREEDWPSEAIIHGAPWRESLRRRKMYLGEGFVWQRSHMETYFSVINQEIVSTANENAKKTDTAMYGVGWREAGSRWLDYDQEANQHIIIGGGSGNGKTETVMSMIISAIYNGSAIIFLDPKVSNEAAALIHYHACKAGREDKFGFLSVSRPELPYNCSINPLAEIHDTSQIGNWLAGILPPEAGANQFFVDAAKDIGRIVGAIVYHVHEFMTELAGGRGLSDYPPFAVLWLEYCRIRNLHKLEGKPEAIGNAIGLELEQFRAIYDRLYQEGREFVAANEEEKELYQIWITPEYSPRYWKLHPGHIARFAIQPRQRLLSYAIRLVFPYLCVGDDRFEAYDAPARDDLLQVVRMQGVVGGQSEEDLQRPRLFELYTQGGLHLLQKDVVIGTQDRRLWSYFYERVIEDTQLTRLQVILKLIARHVDEWESQVRQPDEEYGKMVGNLRAPINELISGGKHDLICIGDSDLTFKRMIEEKMIVAFELGSMSDRKASDAVSKGITQGMLAYAGYLNDRGGKDCDLLFVGDEMFAWVNQDWAEITDKVRSLGIRTVALAQSEAGMRFAVKSDDLMKHIMTNAKNRMTVATPNGEDGQAFVDGLPKYVFYQPRRSVSETPALGDSGNKLNAKWSGSESWSFDPVEKAVVEPEMLSRLPIGQFFWRFAGQLELIQGAYLQRAPVSYLAMVGMDDEQNRSLIEGIHFNVRSDEDRKRLQGWGQIDRLVGDSEADTSPKQQTKRIPRSERKVAEKREALDLLQLARRHAEDAQQVPDQPPAAPERREQQLKTRFGTWTGMMVGKKKDGTWTLVDQGQTRQVEEWRNGLKHGRCVVMAHDGTIEQEMRFEDGILVETRNPTASNTAGKEAS